MSISRHVLIFVLLLSALPEAARAQASGVVEGRLLLPSAPVRKWAPRYPGSGGGTAPMHAVPAVVFLDGELPRSPARDTATMSQKGGRFVPGALAVRSGTVVRFPNADPFFHNVFSYSGPRFDLGRYPSGQSREVLFDRPGIVRTYCEIHEFMRGVVLVTDHGFHAVAEEDGAFRIAGIPPGRYTVRAYHPDLGAVEVPVTVTAGATVSVSLELGR